MVDDRLLELTAERFRALGQPLRLKLLRELQAGEANVKQLVEAVGAGQQNVSQHLAVLHNAGVVSRRRRGARVWYALIDPTVSGLIEEAQRSATHFIEQLARSIGDD